MPKLRKPTSQSPTPRTPLQDAAGIHNWNRYIISGAESQLKHIAMYCGRFDLTQQLDKLLNDLRDEVDKQYEDFRDFLIEQANAKGD